mmetsp:Transcript_68204/g.192278  ORF Transcript_68204/g.192278 Transcript_68204/m.192278 type:complete len:208 (-) Transcript_68204:131-754(-)
MPAVPTAPCISGQRSGSPSGSSPAPSSSASPPHSPVTGASPSCLRARLSWRICFLILQLIGVRRGPKKALDLACFRSYPTDTAAPSSPSPCSPPSVPALRVASATSALAAWPRHWLSLTASSLAPAEASCSSAWTLPLFAASCAGVLPPASRASTSAPDRSRKPTTLPCPPAHAACSGVQPAMFCALTPTPPRISAAFTPVRSPRLA